MSVARYVAPESNGTAQANNPQTTIGRTDTRTWTDRNGDYTIYNPDGSVQNEELGPTSNVNFGKIIPSTATRDPKTLDGWGARGATIEWQVILQHELTPRVGLTGRLLPARRQQSARRRQHAGDQCRLHRAVLHRCPVACRSAWWRRLSGLRSLRHHGDGARSACRKTRRSPATSASRSTAITASTPPPTSGCRAAPSSTPASTCSSGCSTPARPTRSTRPRHSSAAS